MKITRKSIISGITREREIDITPEQIEAWETGALSQVAFPNISDEEREFIMTGISEEEWNDLYSEEE
jgi:hypothetical protein